MCHNRKRWIDALPIVLLGLRSSLKKYIGSTVAELTYGTTLRVPGEFFDTSKTVAKVTPEYVESLKQIMSQIKATQTQHHNKAQPYAQPQLQSCTHVWLRVDSVRPSLTPPYDGPFKIVRKKLKTFVISVRGRNVEVSIDRVKAAHIDTPDKPTALEDPLSECTATVPAEKPYTTRFGRTINKPQIFS